jgi:hypothetical protein
VNFKGLHGNYSLKCSALIPDVSCVFSTVAGPAGKTKTKTVSAFKKSLSDFFN